MKSAIAATGGSLVVCIATPAALYLAADSRYAGAPLSIRDSAHKLLAPGTTALCGLSGLLRFTRTEFDVGGNAAASETTLELADVIGGIEAPGADREPAIAERFADSLYGTLAPLWAEFTQGLDRPFGSSGNLAQILYANRGASGEVFVGAIDLKHSMGRAESGEYSSVLAETRVRALYRGWVKTERIYIRGRKSCASEAPPVGKVGNDAEALRTMAEVFRVSRRGLHCARVIGGPVDVAAIDASGRRWLRRKPAPSPGGAVR